MPTVDDFDEAIGDLWSVELPSMTRSRLAKRLRRGRRVMTMAKQFSDRLRELRDYDGRSPRKAAALGRAACEALAALDLSLREVGARGGEEEAKEQCQ